MMEACGSRIHFFTDTSSAYEEAFGLSWKDLVSFGTLIAALLLPHFSGRTIYYKEWGAGAARLW